MGATVLADRRWVGPHGIGRFAQELFARLPELRPLPIGGRPLSLLDCVRVRRILRRERPSVYFSPGFNPPWRSPVPFVFTIFDLIHLHCPDESSGAKRAYYRWLVRPGARRAYRVLTGSDYSKQRIMEWADLPEERVVVVSAGVGDEFCPEGARHEPGYRYLLYVGNHKPHKNLPRLLEAFAAATIDPEIRLVLTGKPDERLSGLVTRLGLLERVVFAGLIPEADLPGYYRGAAAVVLASLYEGFGLPPLEAMACGTPAVVSDITSLPEVVGEAALLVDPRDVGSIADGLRRVLEGAELRERWVRLGVERAARFTWERTAEQVGQVLEAAAGEA